MNSIFSEVEFTLKKNKLSRAILYTLLVVDSYCSSLLLEKENNVFHRYLKTKSILINSVCQDLILSFTTFFSEPFAGQLKLLWYLMDLST